MDPSDFPFDKQSRKELLGPRPTPLKVHKDSHKVKKPPLPPPTSQQQHERSYHQQNQSDQQSQSFRPPVIIYTVSPKVIHTKPSEFMMLVQRLTGLSSTSSSSSTSSIVHTNNYNNVSSYAAGVVSPAARYATLENVSKSRKGEKFQVNGSNNFEIDQMGGTSDNNDDQNDNHGVVVERRSNLFPGILSPGPSSLQPIRPNFFFSPPPLSTSDPDTISGFFHDLSPVQYGNKTYIEGSFMNSPSTFFSPYMISPTQNFDIFNNFLD